MVLGLQVEGEVQEADLNEVLNLNIGDSIYLATRSLTPEVRARHDLCPSFCRNQHSYRVVLRN